MAGENTPSGWYRIGILKELLQERGVLINEIIPKIPAYPPAKTVKRPLWLLTALAERISYIHKLRGADAIILQRELISTLPTVERLLPGEKILDVDDAIFLHKRGLAAINAAKASIGIVCGNQFLADFFSKHNQNIRIIPTGVNVSDMVVHTNRLNHANKKIIGWIGTPSNLQFFTPFIPDLKRFFKSRTEQVELRIITSHLESIPRELRDFSTFTKWYPGIEFDELPKWTAGLMPLADDDWVKGKCAFKMLQYMSAGIPVIVSPYGMNAEVLKKGSIGFGPKTGTDWYSALECLTNNDNLNLKLGLQARLVAEENYSLEITVDKWMDVFKSWL